MMRDRLAEAIRLREQGRARQDQAVLETTADEKLLYFKRPLSYYVAHLDETE